jgi:hypothetical protein
MFTVNSGCFSAGFFGDADLSSPSLPGLPTSRQRTVFNFTGVRNVTFTHCSFDGAAHGSGAAMHIKTFRGNGGTVENVTYSDIRVNNVKIAILFSMRYFADRPPTNDSDTTPKVKNIYLDNIYSE